MDAVLNAIADFLDRLFKPVARYLNFLGAALIAVACLPIIADVLYRLVAGRSVPGVAELEEFALVIIVFATLAYTQLIKEHIKIDMLVETFPGWLQNVVDVFNRSICVPLIALLSWHMGLQVITKKTMTSQALYIPISIFIAAAVVGAVVLTIILLSDWLRAASKVIADGRWIFLPVAVALAAGVYMLPTAVNTYLDMSGLGLGLAGMCFLFLLLAFRLPVAYGMLLVGFLGLLAVNPNKTAALSMLGITPYTTTASYILMVVPFFVLMGELVFRSRISQDLFDAAYRWFGRAPGGLAMASVAGCAGFGAVCGDSIATAVTMGTVAYPEMRKRKYDPGLATATLACGGTLGILIPPSVGFIFYAIVAEESVGRLFIAGIVPGLIMASLFMGYIYFITKRNPALGPPGEASTLREKLSSLKGVGWMLALVVLILGGIVGGYFSPTEGGAVGAVGAFVIALARRSLSGEGFRDALLGAAKITSMLMFILIGVGVLGYFLAATRLPFELAHFVTGMDVNRYVIFAAVVALYILLGCVMNVIPIILLTLPAILPTILALGFDPIWFGVVTVILMQMGQITPPIGICVFAIGSVVKDVPLHVIIRGILPFFLLMGLTVLLLVLFPNIALWLPDLLF